MFADGVVFAENRVKYRFLGWVKRVDCWVVSGSPFALEAEVNFAFPRCANKEVLKLVALL